MLYKLIYYIFKLFVYRSYYKKYDLCRTFKFNGFLIRISGAGKIVTGESSYISFYSYINVCENTVLEMGDNVSIAHNVKIYTSTFDAVHLIKYGDKKVIKGDVLIGNNVLIGSNTFITPGVRIGNNVVVGANSVITKDLPSNGVYAGSPARLIKNVATKR